jgi:hypothetical protein
MKEVFVIEGKDEFEVEVQLKDIKRRIERSNVKIILRAREFVHCFEWI